MSRRRRGRKQDWDFCWGCGAITAFLCFRCHKPVCVVLNSPVPTAGCSRLRKSPGRIGVYLLVCSPRCRLRRAPQVLALFHKVGGEIILAKNPLAPLLEHAP